MTAGKRDADSTTSEFWSQRYASGRTPWQLDRVPREVDALVRTLSPQSTILVPGCGEDYQTLRAFHTADHRVTAIDFSSLAVERTKQSLPEFAQQIILGDFFQHDFGRQHFEVVYERTFLCSLPPRLWKNYAARVAELLPPHGKLVGFFFYGKESDPPPYPLDEDKAADLFGERFELVESKPATASLPIFDGMERWQEWRLR